MIGAWTHLPPPEMGDLFCLRRGGDVDEEDSGTRRRHNLHSKVLGQCPVVRAGSRNLQIARDRLHKVVSRDRIVLSAPATVLRTHSPW